MDHIRFVSFQQDAIARGESLPLPLADMRRFLALANYNMYWIAPNTGTKPEEIPAHTQYLLYQRDDGGHTAVLPMIGSHIKAALCGVEGGVKVTFFGAAEDASTDEVPLLCIAEGNDPYQLTAQAVAAIAEKLGTFRLRTDKQEPAFMNRLGWCTWDAFYGAVDAQKVLAGLDSFRAAGFPLGFMILDDGAWDSRGDYLYEGRLNPEKFPDGLAALVHRAKEEYGLRHFGVWHNFAGYWAGILPDSPLAKRYPLAHFRANIRPWDPETPDTDLHFIQPEHIRDFYQALHTYLQSQGVDMLKIDGQCALDAAPGWMGAYQRAMQEHAARCFHGQVIHCMCNSVDVAYNMKETNCWRNSDDYIPGSFRKQQEHLYVNAMNALWSSTFAVPDWDMFQTHAPGSEIHAAARAVSGGPVYVSDHPGKQDFALLRRLVTSDGTLLRCDRPALPTLDCLFTDCRKEPMLLKIFNFSGKTGVLGVFNCTEGTVLGTIRARDIPGWTGEHSAVYLQHSKKLLTAGKDDKIQINLESDGYELAFFVPMDRGLAPLGLLDKYNCPAAIVKSEWQGNRLCTELLDGGEIGFYCANTPQGVWCNGALAAYDYAPESGLLHVHAEHTGKTVIDIGVQ